MTVPSSPAFRSLNLIDEMECTLSRETVRQASVAAALLRPPLTSTRRLRRSSGCSVPGPSRDPGCVESGTQLRVRRSE